MFKSHPKGLIPAALSNMGERFGYYIMNAVLLLFLCSKFGLSDETAGTIYSIFYALIYVLSLFGGYVADRTRNYKGTITVGLIIMALGYVLLSIPLTSSSGSMTSLLTLTCVALLFISVGNGLFKGNLSAIVGKMYDDFEAEAAKKGPEALLVAQSKRDSGFQIFYVFINIGGLIAPFIAPYLREWWLGVNNLAYNAELPALCHQFLAGASTMTADATANLNTLAAQVTGGAPIGDMATFCQNYLNVFNTGVHYSFVASVVAMMISLCIFVAYRRDFPNPDKREAQAVVDYTPEEKRMMAKEIKQRLYALFAVIGVSIFFWLSFNQSGQSLSVFARDFVKTDSIAPEIWQSVNPFFVIVLTPIVMMIFEGLSKRGKAISTPRKIAYGMGLTGLAFLFLAIYSYCAGYPSAEVFKGMPVAVKEGMKAGPTVLIVTYFFLTVAELFIAPLGSSFVSKVAPKNLQGLCQGLWLAATAVGNLFIWIGTLMYNMWPLWICWGVFLLICVISMSIMFGMVKWIERVVEE